MEKIRLQKYLAMSGVASRRKSEEYIINGLVSVNGKIVTELGTKVDENDTVKYNGKIIRPIEKKVYILLNKPIGYITSLNDEKNRPIVTDLLKNKIKERVFPIGRLDYLTSGLLILTNDGELTNHITHPRNHISKVYEVLINGNISKNEIDSLINGVDIGGYVTRKAKVRVIKTFKNKTLLEIEIKEGKNRQIRKMISAVGYKVLNLKRIKIGKIEIKDLNEGMYRELTNEEVLYLKNL